MEKTSIDTVILPMLDGADPDDLQLYVIGAVGGWRDDMPGQSLCGFAFWTGQVLTQMERRVDWLGVQFIQRSRFMLPGP